MIKNFSKAMLVIAGLLMFSTVNATSINGVEYGSGVIKTFTSIYFNINGSGVGATSEGIGQVLKIADSDGNTLWNSGDNGVEYNFIFEGLESTTVTTISSDIKFYVLSEGVLSFYVNTIGTFNPTGDLAVDRVSIEAGALNIQAQGHNANVVQGTIDTGTNESNSGSGALDILSGDAFDLIVQDTIARDSFDGTPNGFADSTFNYSSDYLNTAGYDWGGTSDFAMTTIPEPGNLLLFGIGLLGLVGIRKFK